MGIREWLISNIGAIIICLAIVGTIIISWMFFFRKWSLKTINEPENIDKPANTDAPEIVVYLRPHALCVECLMLCIENIGTGAAYNVRFRTGPSNVGDVRFLEKNNFLQKEIRCFGPGQKIEQFLISLIGGLPEKLKKPSQISVTYTNSLNHRYENRYVLDFGEFENLAQIDSIKEIEISDLRPLLDAIQAGFSQIAKNIEHSRPPEKTKTTGSATPVQEEEHPTPIQSERDETLSQELQDFVTSYNNGDVGKLQQNYSTHCSIHVSNDTERSQNPNILAIFKTTSRGSFVAYAIDSESLYAVVPSSGLVLQDALYSSGGFSQVFECPSYTQGCTYHVKVIRPAFFRRDPINDQWTLEEKGELELKEKDS